MSKEYETCPVCDQRINSIHMEIHHYIPESFGGTLDHTIRICGTCHDVVHYYIPLNDIPKYKCPNSLKQHPDVKHYITWLSNRKNHGHIPVKKIVSKLKIP